MPINMTNETFSGEDSDSTLYVGANHDDPARADTGLYLSIEEGYDHSAIGIDVADIPGIIAKLQAVYDDFEAHKPKRPKDVAEALAGYPNGTVIKFESDYHTRYVKVMGFWTSTAHNLVTDFIDWDIDGWPFTVKYEPNNEEEN